MGSGCWTDTSYVAHSTTTRGFSNMDEFYSASTQSLYTSTKLNEALNPYNVMRECCDTEEHPNTIPVILALDVTGSMGQAANTVAKQLGEIMKGLYAKIKDVEFCIMAIGDLAYDRAPIQMSQFESDIRIAENLEKIYFERGGGGNSYESYTAAWYMAVNHTKLDAIKKGRKGIIITMGDEPLNPYLPVDKLESVVGNVKTQERHIETSTLYNEVIKNFYVYHISVDDPETSYRHYAQGIKNTFGELLKQNYYVSTCQKLGETITNIIVNAVEEMNGNLVIPFSNDSFNNNEESKVKLDKNGFIVW